MKTGALTWSAASGLSLITHAGAAAVLLWATQPGDLPEQTTPETRMQLAAFQVPRTEAAVTEPDADNLAAGEAEGTRVGQGAIPSARATPTTPQSAVSAPIAPQTDVTPPASVQSAALPSAIPTPQSAEAVAQTGTDLPASTLDSAPVAAANVQSDRAAARAPDIETATSTPTSAQAVPSLQTPGVAVLTEGLSPEVARPVVEAALALEEQQLPASAQGSADLVPQSAPNVAPATAPLAQTALPQAKAAQPVVETATTTALIAPPTEARASLDISSEDQQTAEPVTFAGLAANVTPLAPPSVLAEPALRLDDETTSPASAVALAALAAQIPQTTLPQTIASEPEVTTAPASNPVALAALTAPTPQATLPQSPASEPDVTTAPAAVVAPPATSARASLAFPGQGDRPVDPVSLAAFQSFMSPGDLGDAATELRDSIKGALSAIPCARLQARFDPDENVLVITGHVPEDGLRNTVLATMQEQMGADIPVREDLLVLPRPQCGALTGISQVGLPQSTDQITNPLLLGTGTHVREFRYTEGQPLVLDIQGADYDAYVYVDFFDAAGNVIHLKPNEFRPLEQTRSKAALQIGSRRPLNPGEPGLYIQIGPPFGQEIAVAFAASEPLYDGVRPLVEPAEPYLAWLQSRVADARAASPDFKGEWVYFFISTSAN